MAAVGGRAHTGGMDTEALFGRSLLTGAQSEDVFVRALTRAVEASAEAGP